MVSTDRAAVALVPEVAHPARVYDCWLGGKDNYEADRRLAAKLVEQAPFILASVRANREFLARAVRHLVREAGITQFIDIGSGLPTHENVHEIAQREAPECRVVYVDNDPIVLAHGRAMLCGASRGVTRVVHGDLREPLEILRDPVVRTVLDLDRPVGVLMNTVLHYLTDQDRPADVVAGLREAIAPGSHIVISHNSWDLVAAEYQEGARRSVEEVPYPFVFRTRARLLSFFDGFELLDPGLVRICDWRPSNVVPIAHRAAMLYGGVGRKQ